MLQMASRPPVKRSKKPQGRSFPRSLVLCAWLIALMALGGLLYWGRSTKVEQRPAQSASQERKPTAAKIAEPPKAVTSKEATQPRLPSAPNQVPGQGTGEAPAAKPAASEASNHPAAGESHGTRDGALLASRRPDSAAEEPSKAIPPPLPPLTPPFARVAIVIDDFGQSLEIARRFLEIPLELTFSVLPHQRHTREIAALAHEHHRQVMLHLPMEPRGYPQVNAGRGVLLLSMSDTAIQQALRTAMDCSPHFVGVNNHMGSHFTENMRVMKAVLEEAKKHRFFFVDSYTSSLSVAALVAQEVRIPFRRRDIFLDNKQSESAIRSQLRQLRHRAKIQGTALAIGHPYEVTLRALRQEAEGFAREKIAVVPAGDLVADP